MTPVASEAVRAALRGHDPTPQQWAVIDHEPVALCVIAGAGSGKTAIIAARIVRMIEQGSVDAPAVLALTFSNKAVNELEQRLISALEFLPGSVSGVPTVLTYNAFADRLVREHGVRIGVDPEVQLLSDAQKWQLLLSRLDSVPPFEAIDSRSQSSIVSSALRLAGSCANHLVTPEQIIREDERMIAANVDKEITTAARKRIELCRLVETYIEAKRTAKRIDFGDQVTKAVEILEAHPEVASALRERHPRIFLDEYQDTDIGQRKLMMLLAPQGSCVTACGDARQAIYSFRGASFYNLIDFSKKHFLRAGGALHQPLSLSDNFRCGSKILDVANSIIEAVPQERRPGEPLGAHPSNGPGMVAAKMLEDEYEEACFIAGEIKKLHATVAPEAGDDREPLQWRDFAILVRRKSLIEQIYGALRDEMVPTEVVGLGGLLKVPEVVEILAWLRVIGDATPQSNVWLARILMGPRFRIHYRDLALLARWAGRRTAGLSKEKKAMLPTENQTQKVADETVFEPEEVAYSLSEALDAFEEVEGLGPSALQRLSRARRELRELRQLARDHSLLSLTQLVIDRTGVGEELDASPHAPATSNRENLVDLLGLIADFAPVEGDASIDTFLSYVDATDEASESIDSAVPAGSDCVKLMTIHQAKGLEFKVVFIPGVAATEGPKGTKKYSIFPNEQSTDPGRSYGELPFGVRDDAEHLPRWEGKNKAAFKRELKERAIEDERRLFYVALTRAKNRSYVTCSWWYGRTETPKGPSSFFDEVAAIPGVELLRMAETPQINPMISRRSSNAVWPPAVVAEDDEVLGEGHIEVLEKLIQDPSYAQVLLSRLSDPARARAQELLQGHRQALEVISSTPPARPSRQARTSLAATRAVELVNGYRSFESVTQIDSRNVSRRIGTEIHQWIEDTGRGLLIPNEEDEMDEGAGYVDPVLIQKLKENFYRMGFGERRLALLGGHEPLVEAPFAMKVGEVLIRGRIDAVYDTQDDGLEIVDFKSGVEGEHPDLDQLLVYAGALRRLGIHAQGPWQLTYAYLASGEVYTRRADSAQVEAGLKRLESALAGAL